MPPIAREIRTQLADRLQMAGFDLIDAQSEVTGRDFLLKIWQMIFSVPLGIAIIHEEMSQQTYANVFYELGVMYAHGKETLVIKTEGAEVPSDFIRTEYVQHDEHFEQNVDKYLRGLSVQAEYYAKIADQLEKNPLLAIDYLRRSYLISHNDSYRDRARQHFEAAAIEARAKSSVEVLLISF